jgi:hypothetical protein
MAVERKADKTMGLLEKRNANATGRTVVRAALVTLLIQVPIAFFIFPLWTYSFQSFAWMSLGLSFMNCSFAALVEWQIPTPKKKPLQIEY